MARLRETVAVLHEVYHLHASEVLSDLARNGRTVLVHYRRRNTLRKAVFHLVGQEEEEEQRQQKEARPVHGPAHYLQDTAHEYGPEAFFG